MQQNPSSQNPQKEKKENVRLEALRRRLKSLLLDNWGLKILSLFIAVVLWAGLITKDPSLTREKQFTGVSINVIGEDTMKRNGFIVLDNLDEVLDDVSIRVSVPQRQYTAAAANNYSVRMDLSRISQTGTQEVRILSTNSSTYGTVTEIIPSTVTLTVDEYVTRYRIPVTVAMQGTAPEGFFAAEPSTNPPMIAVSGPKTLVDRIVSAQVVTDLSTLPATEGNVRRAQAFTLVDEQGKTIQSDMLQVTSESVLLDSIIVEQPVYVHRTVELSDLGLIVGTPAQGYEVKGVYISPGSVEIAGRGTIVREINMLYGDSTVSVEGRSESFTTTLRVRQPATLKYVSTDTVTVGVEIGPVIARFAYASEIHLTGVPEGFSVSCSEDIAHVFLTGAQPWLDALPAGNVSLQCDLSSIDAAGEYTLPLQCIIEGSDGQAYTCEINPFSVTIQAVEK